MKLHGCLFSLLDYCTKTYKEDHKPSLLALFSTALLPSFPPPHIIRNALVKFSRSAILFYSLGNPLKGLIPCKHVKDVPFKVELGQIHSIS